MNSHSVETAGNVATVERRRKAMKQGFKRGKKKTAACFFLLLFLYCSGGAEYVCWDIFCFSPCLFVSILLHTFFVLTHISLPYRRRACGVIRFRSFLVAFRKLRVDTLSEKKDLKHKPNEKKGVRWGGKVLDIRRYCMQH